MSALALAMSVPHVAQAKLKHPTPTAAAGSIRLFLAQGCSQGNTQSVCNVLIKGPAGETLILLNGPSANQPLHSFINNAIKLNKRGAGGFSFVNPGVVSGRSSRLAYT
jgi:hypothetical protein